MSGTLRLAETSTLNMSAVEMFFGALVAITGIALFYLGKGSGQSRFIVFGQTVELSTPALVIIILGCGIFVLPVVLPIWLPDQHAASSDAASPSSKPPVRAEAKDPATKPPRTDGAYMTTVPGITAEITKFAYQDATVSIEIIFHNASGHDATFCTRVDAWRITDEVNPRACGWPLLGSSGNAVCSDSNQEEMTPGDSAIATVDMNCPAGRDDTWSFYAPELKQLAKGLRFSREAR
jgi:hypothetical protein